MKIPNGKSNQKTGQKLEKLAQLKFDYSVLVNELFHLREFMSLVEFDPCYRNDSESFQRFLEDDNLSLDTLQMKRNDDSNMDVNGVRKVRRRQLRASTAVPSTVSEDFANVWSDIDPLVRRKYEEVEAMLDNGQQSKFSVSQKRPVVPKLSQRRVDVKSASPSADVKSTQSISRKRSRVKEEKDSEKTLDDSLNDFVDQHEAENHSGDDFYFTTSSEDEEETKRQRQRKRPRIKLIVHPPKQTVTNPLHVNKAQFTNLHEYINSFKSMDEDVSIEEYEQYIREQRKIVAAIRKGLESGALKYDPDTDSVQPITTKEARLTQSHRPDPISYLYKEQNLQIFQDHLLNHGIYMSKLFQNNRRGRIARAKKVSIMIEQHFKHIAGAEERKAKEDEKHKKNLARVAMQAVKKRWVVAERAYRVLLKDEEEQLKRIKGKEHLSKMLEQSTQLLEAQLNHKTEDATSGIQSESGSGSGSESQSESENNVEDEDELLTSSSEDEGTISEHKENLLSDDRSSEDEKLSVDQLREKYAKVTEGITVQEKSIEECAEEAQFSEPSESGNDLSVTTEESTSEDGSEDDSDPINYNKAQTSVGLFSLLDQHDSDIDSEDESVSFEVSSSDNDAEDDHKESSEMSPERSTVVADEVSHAVETKQVDVETNEPRDRDDDEVTNGSHKFESDPLSVVDVPIPSLLRGELRTYQKQGLNWMASLYNNDTNGILADEMGLGKTIQTISLLAYLACEKQNWGPHLIVVPTSVLLNWEMELKRFAPGFKVLTYYGSPQQRKEKRRGWNKPDAFHICIVSYQLVVQDQNSFKRKKWQYMILDEAHNIKNFRSTRWQALLNFNTRRRLLLTGTPLQNNIAELWSLLYFLMPQTVTAGKGVTGFADLDAFQQWFGKPVDKLIETGENYQQDEETKKTVTKLHQVLRPYLLRRLKADVEKQMPAKYEHVVYCRLSKRQRFLYDDFMSRAQTKATLASGNFMSIVNCLMQLRKVCNHPDLFEVRPILTSFCMETSVVHRFESMNKFVYNLMNRDRYKKDVGLDTLNMVFTKNDRNFTTCNAESIGKLRCIEEFVQQVNDLREQKKSQDYKRSKDSPLNLQNAVEFFENLGQQKLRGAIESLEFLDYINRLRCEKKPVYGKNLIELLTVKYNKDNDTHCLRQCSRSLEERFVTYKDLIENYAVITPGAVTLDMRKTVLALNDESLVDENLKKQLLMTLYNTGNPFHHLQTKLTIAFPDKSLLQYDCGKLQKLATLLQNLKDNGHRALIFTQMTKVLDILEQFLNYHGYLYMRLDGATKIEDRQILTERFNTDSRITVFILSSRSGGLGINLTGADTVIFYDSDWNPAMDKQCQDRCHRIGQTRDVHIYRFVSEHTIESNILKKANQKRHLDNVVIQEGDFTTDYFTKLSVKDLLGAEAPEGVKIDDKPLLLDNSSASKDPRSLERLLAQAEDEDDVKAANLAMKEVEVDNDDFTDQNLTNPNDPEHDKDNPSPHDEYEGTNHVEEYMLRFIANGYYY